MPLNDPTHRDEEDGLLRGLAEAVKAEAPPEGRYGAARLRLLEKIDRDSKENPFMSLLKTSTADANALALLTEQQCTARDNKQREAFDQQHQAKWMKRDFGLEDIRIFPLVSSSWFVSRPKVFEASGISYTLIL